MNNLIENKNLVLKQNNIDLISSFFKYFTNILKLLNYILDNLPLKIIIFDENKNIVYTNIDEKDIESSLALKLYMKSDSTDDYFKINNIIDINNTNYIVQNHNFNNYKVLYLFNFSFSEYKGNRNDIKD